jgi:hypothetical protein
MKCHTKVNSTQSTQLPLKFSYIITILIQNHLNHPGPSIGTNNVATRELGALKFEIVSLKIVILL